MTVVPVEPGTAFYVALKIATVLVAPVGLVLSIRKFYLHGDFLPFAAALMFALSMALAIQAAFHRLGPL